MTHYECKYCNSEQNPELPCTVNIESGTMFNRKRCVANDNLNANFKEVDV